MIRSTMEIFLHCPQCGAEVNMAEDASVFRCAYCQSHLKPVGRSAVQSFFISPNETREMVGEALENVLARNVGDYDHLTIKMSDTTMRDTYLYTDLP